MSGRGNIGRGGFVPRLDQQVARFSNRNAARDAGSGAGDPEGVEGNDPAVQIDQRSAGVPFVDVDVADDRIILDLADDSRRHNLALMERTSDGQDALPLDRG